MNQTLPAGRIEDDRRDLLPEMLAALKLARNALGANAARDAVDAAIAKAEAAGFAPAKPAMRHKQVRDMLTTLAWQIERFDATLSEERREDIFTEIETTIRDIIAAVGR